MAGTADTIFNPSEHCKLIATGGQCQALAGGVLEKAFQKGIDDGRMPGVSSEMVSLRLGSLCSAECFVESVTNEINGRLKG